MQVPNRSRPSASGDSGEFALVGARKLQEIRRKHERAELIFPSGGTNFVQFLTGGEKHIAVGAPLVWSAMVSETWPASTVMI